MGDTFLFSRWFRSCGVLRIAVLSAIVFFAAHACLRLAVSSSLNSDEAELVVFNQSLEWGYGLQPPLYSWLVWGATQVVGMSLLTLTLLRTVILLGTGFFLFLSARMIFRDSEMAVWSTLSLLFIPMMVWHALTYLTHSILMYLVLAMTFYVLMRIVEGGRWYDYLALGIVSALGVLSKYNFAVFLLAIGMSGMLTARVRRRLLHPWLVLSLMVGMAVVLPHLVWAWSNWADLSAVLQLKFSAKVPNRQWFGMPRGVVDAVVNMLLLGGPCAIVFGFLFRDGVKKSRSETLDVAAYRVWVGKFFAVVLFLHMGLAWYKRAGMVHERWLEPYFLLLPIYLFSFVKSAHVPVQAWRRCGYSLAFVALALTMGRFGQLWTGGSSRGFNPIDGSFGHTARELERHVSTDTVLLVQDRGLAGNLRYEISESKAMCLSLDHLLYQPDRAKKGERYLLIWNPAAPGLRDRLMAYVRVYLGVKDFEEVGKERVEVQSNLTGQPVFQLECMVLERGRQRL